MQYDSTGLAICVKQKGVWILIDLVLNLNSPMCQQKQKHLLNINIVNVKCINSCWIEAGYIGIAYKVSTVCINIYK